MTICLSGDRGFQVLMEKPLSGYRGFWVGRGARQFFLARALLYSDAPLYNAIICNATIYWTRLVQRGKITIMTSIFVDSIQIFMCPMQALLLMGHRGPQLRASEQGYPVFFLKLNKKWESHSVKHYNMGVDLPPDLHLQVCRIWNIEVWRSDLLLLILGQQKDRKSVV